MMEKTQFTVAEVLYWADKLNLPCGTIAEFESVVKAIVLMQKNRVYNSVDSAGFTADQLKEQARLLEEAEETKKEIEQFGEQLANVSVRGAIKEHAKKQKRKEYESNRKAKQKQQSQELIKTFPSILRHQSANIETMLTQKLDDSTKALCENLTTAQKNRISQAVRCLQIMADGDINKRQLDITGDMIYKALEILKGGRAELYEIEEIKEAIKLLHSIWYKFEILANTPKNVKNEHIIYETTLLTIPDGVIQRNGKPVFRVNLNPLFFGTYLGENKKILLTEQEVFKSISALGSNATESAFFGMLGTGTHAEEAKLLKICGFPETETRNKSRAVERLKKRFQTAIEKQVIKRFSTYTNPQGIVIYEWETIEKKRERKSEENTENNV